MVKKSKSVGSVVSAVSSAGSSRALVGGRGVGVEWTSRMAFDLALLLESVVDEGRRRLMLEGWCEDYGVVDLGVLLGDVLFCGEVERYRGEVRAGGLSFRMKARVQAEMYLDVVHRLVFDEGVSSAVRADLVKWVSKVAGFDGVVDGGGGGGAQVVINLGGVSGSVSSVSSEVSGGGRGGRGGVVDVVDVGGGL